MLIRVSQAAQELGLSNQAVRNLIRAERLDGHKDDRGLWLVQADSVRDYLAAHGRRATGGDGLELLKQQIDGVAQTVEAMIQTDSTARARAVEGERDRYRAEAVTARAAALDALASADAVEEAMGKLLEAMRVQRQALRQQLLPDSLDEQQRAAFDLEG